MVQFLALVDLSLAQAFDPFSQRWRSASCCLPWTRRAGCFATLFMLSRMNKECRMFLQIVHTVSIEQGVQNVFANCSYFLDWTRSAECFCKLFMLYRLNKKRRMFLRLCSCCLDWTRSAECFCKLFMLSRLNKECRMFLQIVMLSRLNKECRMFLQIQQETQDVFAILFMLSRLNKDRRIFFVNRTCCLDWTRNKECFCKFVHAVSIEQGAHYVFAILSTHKPSQLCWGPWDTCHSYASAAPLITKLFLS